MLHLLTYDLNKAKDYSALYQAIRGLGEAVKDPDLDSVWFLHTSMNANQVSTRLQAYIDRDDRLFVTRLQHNEYSGWMMNSLWPWISARL